MATAQQVHQNFRNDTTEGTSYLVALICVRFHSAALQAKQGMELAKVKSKSDKGGGRLLKMFPPYISCCAMEVATDGTM